MSCLGLALSLLSLAPAAGPRAAEPAGQWVVVTAPAFRRAVEPLCAHRKAQGMRVVVVQTDDVLDAQEVRAGAAGKLRQHINKLCSEHKGPSYVLLVGAIEAGTLEQAEKKVVPALAGTAGRMKGQSTDNGYGCPDGGRLPTVAVGRFPVRTEEEARALVRKTLAFERDRRPGPWRRRLTVLAGIPAYNPFVDRLVEGMALARFGRIDPSWTGRVVYSNPRSHFGVPARRLRAQALKYLQEGQAFTLYLGHSNAEGLYGGEAPYLERSDWARLEIPRGAGVFVTLGCNGCQLKGRDGEGYGVAAVRNPTGPVAVIGPHGIAFAAMGMLAAGGLLESTLHGRVPERLGAAWLALEAGLARGPIDAFTYTMLDSVDGDAKVPQAAQRQEHLEMFVLLGDPALRLPVLPADVTLEAKGPPAAGKPLTVRCRVPARLAGARVRLTLERSVTSLPSDLEPLPSDPGLAGIARDRVLLANHERANRFAVASAEGEAHDGRFEARLDVPAKLPWPRLVLRAYAATGRAEGMGVLSLEVPQKRGATRGGAGGSRRLLELRSRREGEGRSADRTLAPAEPEVIEGQEDGASGDHPGCAARTGLPREPRKEIIRPPSEHPTGASEIGRVVSIFSKRRASGSPIAASFQQVTRNEALTPSRRGPVRGRRAAEVVKRSLPL
jgi:hypothetical protein